MDIVPPAKPFCEATGVVRQISEPRNQASNGKAGRMYWPVLNVARCILFARTLPLSFSGDEVECYIHREQKPNSCQLQANVPHGDAD